MPKYDPNIHHRRSIRLKGYDYTREGLYYITLVTKNRSCFFGKIVDGKMILNDCGEIANECWLEIPAHFPNVILHEHIIMPNHVHGIIELTTAGTAGTRNIVPQTGSQINQFSKPIPGSVSVIIQQYKASVTRIINKNNLEHFQWQSRFYEHIIRNETSYRNIANYIKKNPENW